jgi:hypothetical protein
MSTTNHGHVRSSARSRWIACARLAGLALALTCAAWVYAAFAGDLNFSPAGAAFVRVDWQDPASLPVWFRNHCSVDRGRLYCSNHCGAGYQFYYCSRASFGCCHPGYGYCDWRGRLRCSP